MSAASPMLAILLGALCVVLLGAVAVAAPDAFGPPAEGPFGDVFQQVSFLIVVVGTLLALLAGLGVWGAYRGRRWAQGIAFAFAVLAAGGLALWLADMLQSAG